MNDTIKMMLRRLETLINGKTGETFWSISFLLPARLDAENSTYENNLVLDYVSYASNSLPAGIEENDLDTIFEVRNAALVEAVDTNGETIRNSSGGICYRMRSNAPLREGEFPKPVRFTRSEEQ